MSNVLSFQSFVKISASASEGTPNPRSSSSLTKQEVSTNLLAVASKHGFLSYAVLDISERRNGLIFPRLTFHELGKELGHHISAVEDLTNCSVFLLLNATNAPFPFTTGLDCRTNEAPDPSLLDNKLDGLLNAFGIKGGYCVPVSTPNSHRSVVMYFGIREEHYSRYPSLVLDTIESYDSIWQSQTSKYQKNRFGLSKNEILCLEKLSQGETFFTIGSALALSDHTIKAYIQSCVTKTNANSVYQAISTVISDGLI